MTEIEKMRRYIERTKMDKNDRFYLDMAEAYVHIRDMLSAI